MEANFATGAVAAQTQTDDWQGRQYPGRHRRLVWPCLSLSLRDRCHQSHFQEEERGSSDSELCQRFWRGAIQMVRYNCPCHDCSPAKESYLDFVFPRVLERFRRVGRCGWMRRLLRTAVFE